MIFALFRHTLRRNWHLLAIFFGVLTMYLSVMLSMYNPEDMTGILAMIEALPAGLRAAFGYDIMATDLTGYLASWLYGMLMIAFPMVYSIILANGLVAKMVDNSSFAYLLSTPNTRVRIILTQGVYALTSMLVLFAALFGVGVFTAGAMFSGELDVNAFFRLNFTTMLVNMVVLMIAFFFSCVFNETRLSLSFGAGLPISFLLMKMLGDSAPGLELLADMSLFGFYDPLQLVAGAPTWGVNLIYVALIVGLLATGTIIFNRKRLPI